MKANKILAPLLIMAVVLLVATSAAGAMPYNMTGRSYNAPGRSNTAVVNMVRPGPLPPPTNIVPQVPQIGKMSSIRLSAVQPPENIGNIIYGFNVHVTSPALSSAVLTIQLWRTDGRVLNDSAVEFQSLTIAGVTCPDPLSTMFANEFGTLYDGVITWTVQIGSIQKVTDNEGCVNLMYNAAGSYRVAVTLSGTLVSR